MWDVCRAAFSAIQPGPRLVFSPLSPVTFATLCVFLLKMHNITMCTDVLLIWMAVVRAIPQTLVVFGVLSCTAPHSQCCIKDMKHQPVTLSPENSWNWKRVQIPYSAFIFLYTWIQVLKVCSVFLSSPLPLYFDPQHPIILLACGCKCEVWRFIKARNSASVCL